MAVRTKSKRSCRSLTEEEAAAASLAGVLLNLSDGLGAKDALWIRVLGAALGEEVLRLHRHARLVPCLQVFREHSAILRVTALGRKWADAHKNVRLVQIRLDFRRGDDTITKGVLSELESRFDATARSSTRTSSRSFIGVFFRAARSSTSSARICLVFR